MHLFQQHADSTKFAVTAGVLALAALCASYSDEEVHVQPGTAAQSFAEEHYNRCLASDPEADPIACTLRTIQLASVVQGTELADLVAKQLH